MADKIIVLGGGDSPERDISLLSAANVAKAAVEAGYDVTSIDMDGSYQQLSEFPKEAIVLPILHGKGGEDGNVQAELDKLGLRYLGTGSQASKICFDKALTRRLLIDNDIPVAEGVIVSRQQYREQPLTNKPHILKVSHGGSSIGTLFAREPGAVSDVELDELFALDDVAVLEELVEGIEITVPVLDGKALPVIEIRPPTDGEFDYENKYNGRTIELCPPESLDTEQQQEAQELAEKVHKVTKCRHLSRVDIIVRPDNSMVVLETNTMPGMTSQSLYPKSAKQAGISMKELVVRFVNMAKESGL